MLLKWLKECQAEWMAPSQIWPSLQKVWTPLVYIMVTYKINQ